MKQEHLTYSILDDGVRPCAQFDSVDRAIRALYDATDAIDTEREAQMLDALAADCDAITDAICAVVRRCEEKIPLPRGFFVGEEHRAPAYAAVCRMLLATEQSVAQLQVLSMHLTDLLTAVVEKQRLSDPARLTLLGAREIAREQKDEMSMAQIEALAAKMIARIESTERLSDRARLLVRNVRSLLDDLIPHLLQAMGQAADMEHDGKGCNPIAVTRLLSAFYDTAMRRKRGEPCQNT